MNILEKIIDGCRGVKEDPDMHKHAKELATLVIRDCNEGLRDRQATEDVIAEVIKDLQQAQARGIDRRHKEVLVWKACFDLQKLMEKLNEESKTSDGS